MRKDFTTGKNRFEASSAWKTPQNPVFHLNFYVPQSNIIHKVVSYFCVVTVLLFDHAEQYFIPLTVFYVLTRT